MIFKKTKNYIELINNSYVIEFPKYNKFLYFVFDPLLMSAITFIMVFVSTMEVTSDNLLALLFSLVVVFFMITFFVPLKNSMTFLDMSGHGVGLIKKGIISFLGFTTFVLLGLLIIFLLIILLNVMAFKQGNLITQTFALSLAFGYVVSILSWRFNIYYDTWYGDEEKTRIEFKSLMQTKFEIEKNIAILKAKGILKKSIYDIYVFSILKNSLISYPIIDFANFPFSYTIILKNLNFSEQINHGVEYVRAWLDVRGKERIPYVEEYYYSLVQLGSKLYPDIDECIKNHFKKVEEINRLINILNKVENELDIDIIYLKIILNEMKRLIQGRDTNLYFSEPEYNPDFLPDYEKCTFF